MASPRLIERLRAEDVLRPHAVVEEARRAGLSPPLACALLEKESGRGRNVFGHDPTSPCAGRRAAPAAAPAERRTTPAARTRRTRST